MWAGRQSTPRRCRPGVPARSGRVFVARLISRGSFPGMAAERNTLFGVATDFSTRLPGNPLHRGGYPNCGPTSHGPRGTRSYRRHIQSPTFGCIVPSAHRRCRRVQGKCDRLYRGRARSSRQDRVTTCGCLRDWISVHGQLASTSAGAPATVPREDADRDHDWRCARAVSACWSAGRHRALPQTGRSDTVARGHSQRDSPGDPRPFGVEPTRAHVGRGLAAQCRSAQALEFSLGTSGENRQGGG
jgi:hypothetical protein